MWLFKLTCVKTPNAFPVRLLSVFPAKRVLSLTRAGVNSMPRFKVLLPTLPRFQRLVQLSRRLFLLCSFSTALQCGSISTSYNLQKLLELWLLKILFLKKCFFKILAFYKSILELPRNFTSKQMKLKRLISMNMDLSLKAYFCFCLINFTLFSLLLF